MEEVTQHELFQAAVSGNLPTIQRFLTQPSVTETLARANADHRRRRDEQLATSESSPLGFYGASRYWYGYYPNYQPHFYLHGVFFAMVIEFGHFHVLEWLISASACELIGDTMRGVINAVTSIIIRHGEQEYTVTLEFVLNSHLFMNLLTPAEQQYTIQMLLDTALYQKRDDLIRLAVAHGARVDGARTYECCTTSGNIACIDKMLGSGAVWLGQTFIRQTTVFKDNAATRALLECGVDAQDESEFHLPLCIAVQQGDVDEVEALASSGMVGVNAWFGGHTPLMIAVTNKVSALEMANVLLANGADVRLRHNGTGKTALHLTIEENPLDVRLMTLLLSYGPELVNTQDETGSTPLMTLIQGGDLKDRAKAIEVLLSSGADPFVSNNQGASPHEMLMKDTCGRAFLTVRARSYP
ncbi:hypothetical protein Poli38472_012298 [Pythium oligandrum]|uniref:Uncharacterized protein n=1 Tax=Pythium oligandrum TaxID=41045 RepID=A0A8K1CR65_PYTOL|nr:hypothetical protein Poli38472_012298 [Pythium oligandrum]|eukprot:TMW67182.1 hypothetical protein Poli38472_012298 [Pythium oligandrum]